STVNAGDRYAVRPVSPYLLLSIGDRLRGPGRWLPPALSIGIRHRDSWYSSSGGGDQTLVQPVYGAHTLNSERERMNRQPSGGERSKSNGPKWWRRKTAR
ncbi:MAG: hypothetical protein ACREDR_39810, partial [Blastocatellia bacterium]